METVANSAPTHSNRSGSAAVAPGVASDSERLLRASPGPEDDVSESPDT